MAKRKYTFSSLFLLIYLIGSGFIVLFFVLSTINSYNHIPKDSFQTFTALTASPTPVAREKYTYELEKTTVYRFSVNGNQEEFLTNVPSAVKKIRLDSSGEYLHLIGLSSNDDVSCLDLSRSTSVLPMEYGSSQVRNHACATTNTEAGLKESAYLFNDSFFISVEQKENESILYIETEGKVRTLLLDPSKLNNPNQRIFPVVALSKKIDDKLLLSLGSVFVGIDLNTGSILGYYDIHYTLGHHVTVLPKSNYVIANFSYEGTASMSYLFDISGQTMKVVDFKDYGSTNNNSILGLKDYVWNEGVFTIDYPNIDHYENNLPQKIEYYLALKVNSDIERVERETEKYYMQTGKYKKVVCILDPSHYGYQGSDFGCYGLKTVNTYKYTDSGFIKVN